MEESGRSPQGEQVIRVSLDKTVQQFLGLKLTTKKFHGIAGIYDLTTIVHDQNILLIPLLLHHLLLSHPFFSIPLFVSFVVISITMVTRFFVAIELC